MPGFEPFLLCDFHIHTRWSDGVLGIREVCDLYGQTGHVDVIAITDHILMERDWLARAGRLASFGRRRFSVTREVFSDYLAEIATRPTGRGAGTDCSSCRVPRSPRTVCVPRATATS